MLKLHRHLPVAMALWLLIALAIPAIAQDANTDQAKAMLNKGIAQYKALNFKAAKATLLQVDTDYLTEDNSSLLGEYLTKADTGIRKQSAALEAYRQAEQDLRTGALVKARYGFAFAALSEYIHSQTRADARAKVAEVDAKIELLAQQTPVQNIQPEPIPTPVTEPSPEPLAPANAPVATFEGITLAPIPEPVPEIAPADESLLGPITEAETTVVVVESPAAGSETESVDKLLETLARRRAEAGPEDFAPPVQAPAATSTNNSILVRLQENLRVARQVSDLEFENALTESRKAISDTIENLAQNSFDSASNNANIARNILQQNKRLYNSEEFSFKILQVEDQLTSVADKQQLWQAEKVNQRMDQIERSRRERIRREQQQLARKIDTLHERAQTLLSERNNEEALQIIRQILTLDTTNRWAAEKLDLVRQLVLLEEERTLDSTQGI